MVHVIFMVLMKVLKVLMHAFISDFKFAAVIFEQKHYHCYGEERSKITEASTGEKFSLWHAVSLHHHMVNLKKEKEKKSELKALSAHICMCIALPLEKFL